MFVPTWSTPAFGQLAPAPDANVNVELPAVYAAPSVVENGVCLFLEPWKPMFITPQNCALFSAACLFCTIGRLLDAFKMSRVENIPDPTRATLPGISRPVTT